MKPSVCHVTSAHAADDIRIFHKECFSLAEAGYTVHLVAAGSLPAGETGGVLHHTLAINKHFGRLGRILFGAWKAYRAAKATQAEIVHIHDPELLPYALLLKWQGRSVFYDAHEDLPRDLLLKAWIPKFLKKPLASLVEYFEQGVARRMDAVVAATPFIADRFHRIGVHAVVVKNYPRLSELRLEAALTEDENPLPRLCYIGLISIERGIVEMIHAVEDLDVRLVVAGSFNNKQTEELAKSLPGWAKVDYRGVLSRKDIAKLCAQADLGLCLLHPTPTYSQALPIKLFEYMSVAMPVLSSNIPLWVDIVDRAQCGLCVDPKNIEAIKGAIQWLLQHPNEARAMGKNGQQAIEEQYNWETESEHLLDLYRKWNYPTVHTL